MEDKTDEYLLNELEFVIDTVPFKSSVEALKELDERYRRKVMDRQDVDNFEMHSEAEVLSDQFSSYALAKMYIQKSRDTDKVMEENRHLQGEIERYKYMIQECEMENEDFRRDNTEYRRQISSMRSV